ncbi:hypothetical protein AB5J72_23765 [Streptomyces sp. CG1]|uniref:hypothetical protein n=1 Tax=Streptomyces sp. CG1 TaxID=1287523 RepID=UPI0034E300F9
MSVTTVVIAQRKGPGNTKDKGAGTGGIVAGACMTTAGPWLGGFVTDRASWR